MRWRRTLILVAVSLLFAAPVPSAHGETAQKAIRFLNAQREAHGIPGGIVENPDWSRGCALHLEYMRINPDQWETNAHDEDPSRQGYTPEGREAAQSSVLDGADGYAVSGGENPWESAPLHLNQLLGPSLSVTGYADTPRGCMWTWPGYLRRGPDPPVLYTYPGDGATIYPALKVFEDPDPGQFIGLPPQATTGPYLQLLVHGADDSTEGRLNSAALTGPRGPVEVRTMDNFTPGLENSNAPGAIVVPIRPLEPDTRYTAEVTFTTVGGAVLTRRWTFTTEAQSVSLPSRRVRAGRDLVVRYVPGDDGRITTSLRNGRRISSKSTEEVVAGRGHVTLAVPARVRPGRYTFKATLNTSAGTTRYNATVRVLPRR